MMTLINDQPPTDDDDLEDYIENILQEDKLSEIDKT